MTLMIERTPPQTQASERADPPEADQAYLRPRRWTRAEYYRLGEAGFFDGLRVELLDGEIWTLPPQETPHFSAIRRATASLAEAFGPGFEIREQAPLALDDGTEPEPDVVVVAGSSRDYEDHHPAPTEVHLLIEVSDATLRKDRGEKAEDYARAGIADYWIINLVHRQLEVFRDPLVRPDDAFYRSSQILLPGQSMAPLSVPEREVEVAELFPSIPSPAADRPA